MTRVVELFDECAARRRLVRIEGDVRRLVYASAAINQDDRTSSASGADNPSSLVELALDVAAVAKQLRLRDERPFAVRIAIHSAPCVAAVGLFLVNI
jgi:hypothetical protein